MIAAAEGAGATPAVVRAIAEHLEADRLRYAGSNDAAPYLDLNSEARALLPGLGPGPREDRLARIARQVKQAESLQVKLEEIERQLASVPDEADVQALAKARAEAEQKHAEAERELRAIDADLERVTRDKLKSHVGRAYTLRFDDRKGSTEVEPGYFWP